MEGSTVLLRPAKPANPTEIDTVWFHGDRPIVKFRCVDSIDAAEALRGALICIPSEQREPLADGEVYLDDLIGCQATESDTKRQLGVVEGWQDTGAVPLLTIRTQSGSELLVPFAASICEQIDVENKQLVLRLPEGLLELNEP